METNIGSIILEHCRNKRVSVPTLAAKINMSTIGLYKLLQRDDIKVSRLISISRALNHNFFTYFTENTSATQEQLLKLTTENRELTTKVAHLQKENAFQYEIIALLKAKGQ